MQWLSAVELALLKGRHPLLKDVDITINPSKGLAFVDGGASDKRTSSENKVRGSNDSATFLASHNIPNRNSLLKLTQSNPVNGFLVDPLFNGDSRAENKENSRTKQATELDRANRVGDMEQKQDSLVDSDESQVLQTAVVVMNMLDYTMPGTLNDEQKRKVQHLNDIPSILSLIAIISKPIVFFLKKFISTVSICGLFQTLNLFCSCARKKMNIELNVDFFFFYLSLMTHFLHQSWK